MPGTNDESRTTPGKDYKMTHGAMSRLPPKESDCFGGVPDAPLALPPSLNKMMPGKRTKEQHTVFKARMEELRNARQEESKRAQEGQANLLGMLRERH